MHVIWKGCHQCCLDWNSLKHGSKCCSIFTPHLLQYLTETYLYLSLHKLGPAFPKYRDIYSRCSPVLWNQSMGKHQIIFREMKRLNHKNVFRWTLNKWHPWRKELLPRPQCLFTSTPSAAATLHVHLDFVHETSQFKKSPQDTITASLSPCPSSPHIL